MGTPAVPRTSRLSFLGIIAWLSICLLITGLFTSQGMQFGSVWVMAGLFGLAAAVGLSESAKSEALSQKLLLDTYISEARTDPLTGLANRRAFDLELDRLTAERRSDDSPLSLALIDMDHFEQFNAEHGFHAGDEMLRGVARILRTKAGGIGIATRFGGEQFAVILMGMELQEAEQLALRLRGAIDHHQQTYRGVPLSVTASVGVASALGRETAQQLVVRADECLYAAKEGGRNCVYTHDGQSVCRAETDEEIKSPVLV